jgi:hypothetical protein
MMREGRRENKNMDKKEISEAFMQVMEDEFNVRFVDVTPPKSDRERLAVYEKYIHVNRCSDEGGWFAYFCPNGSATKSYDKMRDCDLFVNGCDSEEEAIQVLIQTLISLVLQE